MISYRDHLLNQLVPFLLGRATERRLLGTPPSGRSPKEHEAKTSGAMKPTSRASAEMPVSWVLGLEDEDMRRPGDTSVLTTSGQWAPRSSSIRSKRAAWSCGPFLSCTVRWLGFGNHVYVQEYSGNMTVVRVQKSNCTLEV
jgi:hypothetical protein